jgi:putative membrane protein
MVRYLLVRWLVLALAIGIVAALVPDVEITGGVLGVVWVAALFGLVNAIIGPVLRLLTLPLTMLTFGLFALVVNGLLLAITAWLTDLLTVGGFLTALWAALLISMLTAVLSWVLLRIEPLAATR